MVFGCDGSCCGYFQTNGFLRTACNHANTPNQFDIAAAFDGKRDDVFGSNNLDFLAEACRVFDALIHNLKCSIRAAVDRGWAGFAHERSVWMFRSLWPKYRTG